MSFLAALRPRGVQALRSTATPSSLVVASSSRTTLPSASGSILPAFSFGAAVQTRNSTKRGGGSTRNGRNSAGRRLGVKRHGGQFVQPGAIILRQRGTSWHAGANVRMGSDHTLYATAPGFVRFYAPLPEPAATIASPTPVARAKELALNPIAQRTIVPVAEATRSHPSSRRSTRRYVGVALSPSSPLPAPRDAPRERRFDRVDLAALDRERDVRAVDLAQLEQGLTELGINDAASAEVDDARASRA